MLTTTLDQRLWNGHFEVSFRNGYCARFRWQHFAGSALAAHESLVRAAKREYPDATSIRCNVLPDIVLDIPWPGER